MRRTFLASKSAVLKIICAARAIENIQEVKASNTRDMVFERPTFFTLGENVRFCLAAVDAGGKVLDELVHY